MKPPNLYAVKAVQRWTSVPRRLRAKLAWKLRPNFLKSRGGEPIRLRWWVCYQLMQRLDKRIRHDLNLGRKLMYDHHEAGMNHPEYARGRRLAVHARLLEARMLWLAYEGGSQFLDGSSNIELIHFAGMDTVRNPSKAR